MVHDSILRHRNMRIKELEWQVKSLKQELLNAQEDNFNLRNKIHYGLEAENRMLKDQINGYKISQEQYRNLRMEFGKLVDDLLGPDYYNEAMDVYTADKNCCDDIRGRYMKKPTTFPKRGHISF